MATIKMQEISANSPKNASMTNYIKNLDGSRIEISTSSIDAEKFSCQSRIWDLMENFNFDCSVSFGYNTQKSTTVMNCETSEEAKCAVSASSLLGDEKYSDFTIILNEEKELKVHKCVLGSASNVFDTMFSTGLDETKFGTASIDCDPELFHHLLRFIYTGLLPTDEISEICIPLFVLADRYNVANLMKACLTVILDMEIKRENVLDLYKLASTYDLKELLKDSWNYIKL